jgi:hypothetical protein
VHIAFEELGLKYNVHKIDISKNTQKEEWFLKICRKLASRKTWFYYLNIDIIQPTAVFLPWSTRLQARKSVSLKAVPCFFT